MAANVLAGSQLGVAQQGGSGMAAGAPLAAAGIQAGAGLLGGLFSAAAEKKRQQEALAAQQQAQGQQLQSKGISQLSRDQQSALSNLVGNFGRALGV